MRILITGIDGYIGWPLALKQLSLGNHVIGLDNFSRRKNVEEMDSWSALPIPSFEERINYLKNNDQNISFFEGDITSPEFIDNVIKSTQPDAIVHLAEQSSAPFSMIDQQHNIYTQQNNVIGTLNLLHSFQRHIPEAHLVKLGTMGEYGYDPGLEIPEGFFEIEFRGKKATVPFPKLAGSWYHWSKVHDSNNIMFACKLWNLRSTDVMQGIVYGTKTAEISNDELSTRYDFDEAFGTVLNRFCAQAIIGHPLTVYGKGTQTRGFLALTDSIQCISLLLENPPELGEYRVVNQFAQQYSVLELASKVQKIGNELGLDVKINHKHNPRVEKEVHYYKADHQKLVDLGFKASKNINDEIRLMLNDLLPFRNRIENKKHSIVKDFEWKGK